MSMVGEAGEQLAEIDREKIRDRRANGAFVATDTESCSPAAQSVIHSFINA